MTRALVLVLALLAAGCAGSSPAPEPVAASVAPATSRALGRRLVGLRLTPPKVRPAGWEWPAQARQLGGRKGGPIGPAVVRELNRLGITVNGVYTPPSSGLSNPLTADLSVGGNLITSVDGTAQLELVNNFAALRDSSGSSEVTASATGLDLTGHSQVEVSINGSGVGTFNSSGLVMASGKATTGGALSWTSSTLTYSLGSNTATAFMRREGDTAVFRCNLLFSGAPAAGNLLVTLPTGLTVNTSKLPGGGSTTTKVGCGAWLDAGVNRYPSVSVWLNDSTSVYVLTETQKGSTGDPMEANGTQALFTVGASDELYFEFAVPVTGW